MIYNSSHGQQEGHEADKLIFHWLNDGRRNYTVEHGEQIDDICLCDASVGVSEKIAANIHQEFADDSDSLANSVSNTDQSEIVEPLILTFDSSLIMIFRLEPETSIWMAAHVTKHQSSNFLDQIKEGRCLPAKAIQRVLMNIYTRFCLLHGTFGMIYTNLCDTYDQEMTRSKLRHICNDYFSNTLPDVHLGSLISNPSALHNNISYLDLNQKTLMSVINFINNIIAMDPQQIQHLVLIFNDRLLWSNLDMGNTRSLYNYLLSVPIRQALREELSRDVERVRRLVTSMPIYLKRTLRSACLSSEQIDQECNRSSDICVGDALIKKYMTIFRSSNNLTIGLIIKDPDQEELIARCERSITSDNEYGVIALTTLAQCVGQNYLSEQLKKSSNDSPKGLQNASKRLPTDQSTRSRAQ